MALLDTVDRLRERKKSVTVKALGAELGVGYHVSSASSLVTK